MLSFLFIQDCVELSGEIHLRIFHLLYKLSKMVSAQYQKETDELWYAGQTCSSALCPKGITHQRVLMQWDMEWALLFSLDLDQILNLSTQVYQCSDHLLFLYCVPNFSFFLLLFIATIRCIVAPLRDLYSDRKGKRRGKSTGIRAGRLGSSVHLSPMEVT